MCDRTESTRRPTQIGVGNRLRVQAKLVRWIQLIAKLGDVVQDRIGWIAHEFPIVRLDEVCRARKLSGTTTLCERRQ